MLKMKIWLQHVWADESGQDQVTVMAHDLLGRLGERVLAPTFGNQRGVGAEGVAQALGP